MFLNILGIPFFNFFVLIWFGRYLGWKGVRSLIYGSFFLIVFYLLVLFHEVLFCREFIVIFLYKFLELGYTSFCFSLLFDNLVIVMLFIIIFISGLVQIFSLSYMGNDKFRIRFISYLALFTFAMLFLVTSDNFLQLFFGWELVGLASFLLISFWYTRILANQAALKAMLVNRVGDVCLLIFMGCCIYFYGSLDYFIVFSLSFSLYFNFIYILGFVISLVDFFCLFLFLGAIGKSAQIFFHVWLPDAMEGPTPVSALLHAATMVTAGVFLVIRCSVLFELSESILFWMCVIGSITCLVMGILGLYQFDLKKVVAYSTCSQLGYMFLACGVSNYNGSLFHLFNHAFFKALLFLGMGSLLHALLDEQDIRKYGNLFYKLPVTYISVLVGTLTLIGIFFLSGFYSKDFIIEYSFSRFNYFGFFSFLLGLFSVFLTALYSIRLYFLIFLNSYNGSLKKFIVIKESDNTILSVLGILSICSIFVGFLFKDLFIGLGSLSFTDVMYLNGILFYDFEFLNFYFLKKIPFGLILLSYLVILFYNNIVLYYYSFFRRIFFIFCNLFLFDKFYNNIVSLFLEFNYYQYYKIIEMDFFQYTFIKLFVMLYNKFVKYVFLVHNLYLKNSWFFVYLFFQSFCVFVFSYIFSEYFFLHYFMSLVIILFILSYKNFLSWEFGESKELVLYYRFWYRCIWAQVYRDYNFLDKSFMKEYPIEDDTEFIIRRRNRIIEEELEYKRLVELCGKENIIEFKFKEEDV